MESPIDKEQSLPSNPLHIALACAAIMAATWIVYAGALRNPFIFDDVLIVNDYARRAWNHILDMSHGMRPLFKASIMTNLAISGQNTWSYHAFNTLFQGLSGIALFGLLFSTFKHMPKHVRENRLSLAFIIALLWTIHPLNTRAVAYISQRCEILMGVFYFSTLFCLSRVSRKGSPSVFWQISALAGLVLGLASKEVMITVVPVCFLFQWIFLCETRQPLIQSPPASLFQRYRRLAFEKLRGVLKNFWLFYSGLAVGFLFILIWIGPTTILDYALKDFDHAWSGYLVTQSKVICQYLRLSLFPDSLCFDYGWPLFHLRDVWLEMILVATLVVITLWSLFRHPFLGFWGAFFFINLAPRSSILVRPDVIVEHRMYLPLVAVVVLCVLGVNAALPALSKAFFTTSPQKHATRLVFGVAIGVFLLLAGSTIMRLSVYKSNLLLWSDTVRKSPTNPRALNYLGIEYANRGETKIAKDYFAKAVALAPDYDDALNNLANQAQLTGDFDQAIELYLRSLAKRKPGDDDILKIERSASTHRNLGRAYAGKGDFGNAEKQYRQALNLLPDLTVAHFDLALMLINQNRLKEAQAHLSKAVDSKEVGAYALNELGRIALGSKKLEEAKRYFQEALSRDPNLKAAKINLELANKLASPK